MLDGGSNNLHPSMGTGAATFRIGAPPVPDRFGNFGDQVIYVTRYCSLNRASLRAAVHDGFAVLKVYAAGNRDVTYRAPVLVIRNKRESTATLDICLPIDGIFETPTGDEIHLGPTPTWAATSSGGRGSLGEFLDAAGAFDDASAWLLDFDNAELTRTGRRALTTH